MSAGCVCLIRDLYGGDREHCVLSYSSPTHTALILINTVIHNINNAKMLLFWEYFDKNAFYKKLLYYNLQIFKYY